jgi:hypothetical protein
MSERLIYPLLIYVVWHESFLQGQDIANNLYSIFCRDVDQPLSRGLGIPVNFRMRPVNGKMVPIETDRSERVAIITLIDANFFMSDLHRKYTSYLLGLINQNVRVFPVALFEQAYEFGNGLEVYQFIRAFKGGLTSDAYFQVTGKNDFDLSDESDFNLTIGKIKRELLHDCARLMMNFQSTSEDKEEDKALPSPIKLFLSHAKKDGLETTTKFKNYIDSELKLDVFFDTVDIADGYNFEQQIEAGIKNSALVVFHTDEYSSREWCRIEVLIAKRNKCPIVVVHDIKIGEKRAFPYLGNTPTITYKSDEQKSFSEIINLTLYQVLGNLFQISLLESFSNQFNDGSSEYILISSPPELFNYIDIYKKKLTTKSQIVVLYPEPPLGAEELKILNEIDTKIKFITPIHLPALNTK